MSVPRMVSIGAGVQDVFLHGKVFQARRAHGMLVEEFPLGAKLDVDEITFSTGGGATNAAVTFARHGLHSSFMGKIGTDPAGQAVLDELHREDVDTRLVAFSKKYSTGYSALLLAPNGERTILTYRGASTHYVRADFDLDSAEADWYYLSSLAGNMEILRTIVKHAHAHGIKVAINPGKAELEQKIEFMDLLKYFTVIGLNKDELQLLLPGDESKRLVLAMRQYVPYVVMTDGPHGVVAAGPDEMVIAGMYEDVPVVDRTGAGDAFHSGFVAKIAEGESLAQAVTFASANSTSVVAEIGAKKGILPKNTRLHEMPLTSMKLIEK